MDGPTPDLQAILATLSQFTTPAPTAAPPPVDEVSAAVQYDASTAINNASYASNVPILQEPPPVAKAQDPRLRPQSRSATASPKPMIDPATIITWQDGLRCVTKIAAQNAQFSLSVRKMMDDQKKHEMRWYGERQALKQSQATRATASTQVHSILQSLGGGVLDAAPATQSEAEKETELANFDRKIYAAQVSMEAAMTGELKGLGVPFFGTPPDKVVPDGVDIPTDQTMSGSTITESDLMRLRRRMVGHLEDLYRD